MNVYLIMFLIIQALPVLASIWHFEFHRRLLHKTIQQMNNPNNNPRLVHNLTQAKYQFKDSYRMLIITLVFQSVGIFLLFVGGAFG